MPPLVTKVLLALLLACFLLQQAMGDALIVYFALWPLGDFPIGAGADGLPLSVGFQPWQLVTYGLLHGDFMHLLFNGIALYQFGGRIEETLGQRRYMTFYLVCVIGAGLCQLVVTTMMVNSGSNPFPTIGASGGVFGLLLAYGLMFPRDRMIIFPIPVPVTARTMVIVFGIVALVMGLSNSMPGIAHFAHLGGMLFGWLLLRYWRGQPPFKRRPPPRPRLVH